METVHLAKITEITKDAEKCLINEYMVIKIQGTMVIMKLELDVDNGHASQVG